MKKLYTKYFLFLIFIIGLFVGCSKSNVIDYDSVVSSIFRKMVCRVWHE